MLTEDSHCVLKKHLISIRKKIKEKMSDAAHINLIYPLDLYMGSYNLQLANVDG
jgi:hypothetical protein